MSEETGKNTDALLTPVWQAAGVLRGSMEAGRYHVAILALVFLRCVSACRPAEADQKDLLCVPQTASWETVLAAADTEGLCETVDQALTELEQANPVLQGSLFHDFRAEGVNGRKLSEAVRLLSLIPEEFFDAGKDVLGTIYSFCMKRFAEQGGGHGEFYTPESVVALMVGLLRPSGGVVYDPCAGSGNLLVQGGRYALAHSSEPAQVYCIGQEVNRDAWRVARMHMAVQGIQADLGLPGDTFLEDCHKDRKADWILANPPFNQSGWYDPSLEQDPRFCYGMPPKNNANFAWLQHILSHLKEKGKAAVLLSNSALSAVYQGEGRIRENLIRAGVVRCIVSLPPQLFYTTQMPASIWILQNAPAECGGEVLFLQGEELGYKCSRRQRILTKEDIDRLCAAYASFNEGSFQAEPGFSATAGIEEIKRNEWMLNPVRYTGSGGSVPETEDVPPEEQPLRTMVWELQRMFDETDRLQERVLQELADFGISPDGAEKNQNFMK